MKNNELFQIGEVSKLIDFMAVGDTDFSPPATTVNFVLGDSSRRL